VLLHRREKQRFQLMRRPRWIRNAQCQALSTPAGKFYREAMPTISLPSPRPRRHCCCTSGQLSSGNDGEGRPAFVGPNLDEIMKHFGMSPTSNISKILVARLPPIIFGFGGSRSSPDVGQRMFYAYQLAIADKHAQWRS
jgi:hypothetical protein